MHDFQGYFSRTFQDQSDFPGLSRSWNFQEKKSRTFQDIPGGVGTLSIETEELSVIYSLKSPAESGAVVVTSTVRNNSY